MNGDFLPKWNGTHIDSIARQLKNTNQLPEAESILKSENFHSLDPEKGYPLSGSFVRFLLTTHGLNKLKTFFSSVSFNTSASETKNKFQAAYGISYQDAWQQWNSFLN